MDPGSPRKQDREQFGGAVDHQPRGEIGQQPGAVEQPQHRPQPAHVVDQQQQRRHRESEAEREGEDRDLRIVVEQCGRKQPQSVLALAAIEGRAQRRAARAGDAGIAAVARDQCGVPAWIARHQHPADDRSRDHHRQGDGQIEPHPAHRPAPAAAEEPPQPAAQPDARAINQEPGALGQPFEIGQRAGVERSFARDRQAGGDRAVQHRQGEQVLVRNAREPPGFHARDDGFQPLPVRLAFQPEAVRAQCRLLHGENRLGRLGEPATDSLCQSRNWDAHPIPPERLIAR